MQDEVRLGAGRMLTLNAPQSVNEVAKKLCQYFGIHACRISMVDAHNDGQKVSKIAICAGSGGGLFETLPNLDVDLLITGEMGHHQVLSANKKGMSVCLFEHSNTERGYLEKKFKTMLENVLGKENLGHIDVVVSEHDKDPLSIFIP